MTQHLASQPIGIFDSGVGGLTVLREISRHLPQEDLVYIGDTARLPYGNKSSGAIIQCTSECAHFLLEQKIKLLIVACHTASAHALDILQETLPIPVIGVIQPGFELLMENTRTQRVAILATASTIASNVYQNLIRQHYPLACIFPIACPLFVPLAEEHFFDHPAAELIAVHYLQDLHAANIDAVLLACTHYPILRKVIEETVGPDIAIIDSAEAVALRTKELLMESGLLASTLTESTPHLLVSDLPQKFSMLYQLFMGSAMPDVELVEV